MASDEPREIPLDDDPVAALLQEVPREEGRPGSERLANTIASGVMLVIASLYVIASLAYAVGTPDQPGPGMFPVIIGVGLAISSVGLLIESLRIPRERMIVWPYPSGAIRLAAAVAASTAYVVLLPLLGQLIAGALVSLALLWSMRLRPWWLVPVLSVVFSTAVAYLFGVVLNVQLPRGPLYL